MPSLGSLGSWVSVKRAATVLAAANITVPGASYLGILDGRTYPQYLGASQSLTGPSYANRSLSPTYGAPWGNRTVANTDPYDTRVIPDTGVTRSYHFTVAGGMAAPDGVQRPVITVNGQFPGPCIEANWGDWIEVTVDNQLPNEGTSLHWHGLIQKLTPYYDGVPSVTQCPIAPGKTLIYRFRAEQHGSSWYHAHYSAQFNAGVLGPMIIYGPSSQDYDIDLGPVLLTDWYHQSYYDLVEQYTGTDLGIIPFDSKNNLINGRGQYDCSQLPDNFTLGCEPGAPLSQFKFQSGKVHRLRVMNSGSEGVQKFTIDNHKFTVIAQDLVPVEPFETGVLTLGVGQRTDILVNATMPANSAVWMRASISPGVVCGGSAQGDVTAKIYYENANTSNNPTSTPTPLDVDACINDPLDQNFVPAWAMPVTDPGITQEITVGLVVNETGHFNWELNNATFRANYNHPVAPLVAKGNTSFPVEWQVTNFGDASSVRIILNNPTNATHPMHMHGHDFQVLAEGPGEWDGTVVNPSNPVRRDTHIVRPYGYLVMQISNDNPGVWPFHCHVAWHLSGGLYMNLLMRPDEIDAPPDAVAQTCIDWDAFSNQGPVDQIDSGL